MSKARASVFVVAGMIVASMASSAAWAALLKAADWQMDETEGQMLDSSANNNNGTPTNVDQGVQEDVDGDGVAGESTYLFNGSNGSGTSGNEEDPSHVVVPDADSLDPQANDITLTARVRVGVDNTHQMDDDSYDVVRKGLVTTDGGDYKMEIKRVKANPTVGKLHCFFRGDQASVNKVANLDVVDGTWHKLECIKTSTSVVAKVDGRSFTPKAGSAGSISNASNVMVGAKKVTQTRGGDLRGDDVFDGSMDFVSIEINQPDIAQ